jgi:hypothetical protein
VEDLSDNIIYIALMESSEKLHESQGSVIPIMIDAMNRGLDKFPEIDNALKSGISSPIAHQYRDTLTRYANIIENYFETYGEYPVALKMPKPANNLERYVWMLAEAFLQYKTGQKARLNEI